MSGSGDDEVVIVVVDFLSVSDVGGCWIGSEGDHEVVVCGVVDEYISFSGWAVEGSTNKDASIVDGNTGSEKSGWDSSNIMFECVED